MRKIILILIPLLLIGVNILAAQGDQPAGDADNALIIADVLPADGSQGVDPEATITVIFNRPVVPLMIVEEMDDLPDPLTIEPAVEGEGEWLNTSIYVFRPDSALAGGTTYTVTVDDVMAVDGSVLSEPYTWSFTTVNLAVSEVVPLDGTTDVVLDQTVQVRFNQPVDRASAESAFYLRNTETNELVSGTFEWAEDSAGFRFIPDEELELDAVYEAGFAQNTAQGAGGGDPLAETSAWVFETVPLPEIVSTMPRDGEQNVYPYGGFTIYFASPMDVDSFEGKIEIDPEPWREYDSYYGDWDNSYTLSFPTEPSTDYTITILPGLRDIYGNEITETTVIRYRTAPYDPDVMLQVPGSVGFYNGSNEQTQLFLTHRNVSQIDLELYRMETSTFLSLRDSYNLADQVTPSDLDLLRRWTIESVAPLNARRYELLNLGGTQVVDCPGAPESRLMIGDTALVVATDALRARETPPDGEIVTLLYRDYQLPVVGGPVCDDGILWWEVTLRDDRRAWVAEGTTDEYFLDVGTAAERTPVDVVDANGEALPPGIYLLRATAPETAERGYSPTTHLIVVGTANLTFKNTIDGALVWATDVNTGLPIADAPITFYDAAGVEVGSGATDEDGLLDIDLPDLPDLYVRRSAVIDTGDYFGVTYSGWSEGIEGWNFGQFSTYYPERYRGYLYTDRPIYRPDQPVYFRGILRARDDVRYTPTTMGTVDVQITDPEGQIVYQQKLPLSEYGTYSDQFNLDPDAALGYYRIGVTLPGDQFDTGEGGSVTFGVAEYRVPEFEVTVSAQTPEVVQGETITLTIDSRYYFGGVVSGANVEYNVVAEPYFFEYEGGSYSFIDYDADSGASEIYSDGGGLVTSGEGVTDESGQLVIEVPADLDDAAQSQQYTIEAVVSDESGQAVAGRTDVIVHKGLVYVGVQPENYVSTAGDETTFNLIAVDWDGEPVADQVIDVEIVERRWSSVQEQDELGRTTWTYEVEEIPVTSGDVTTDAQGRASFTFTPPNGGVFKLKASTRDTAGNTVISANTIWVSGREYVAWRQQNSNRIDLIADSTAYEVGDTAEILITSPFQGATEALVTVERGGILTAERITLESNSYVYELPIEEDFAPNVYVTVMLVKGVDANNPVAAFRMGMVQLAVDNERKQLTIEIEPDVEQAGPGDTVTYTVRTIDFDGNPVQAEVGVGLSDLASLSIAEPNSQPLLTFFYGQQGLSVRTATPLTINTDQITQTVLDTIKGGGGGLGEGGIFDIREEFIDTPYWNPSLITDENGEATFSVTLPDNLTTWRLDARALTIGEDGNMLVGQTTLDLLSTKPLLIRPVTPRFFVAGDQVTLGAVVNNNTDEDLNVRVALSAETSFEFGEGAENPQMVTVPAGQSIRVNWEIVVPPVAGLDFVFYARDLTETYEDASIPPLSQDGVIPVLRYEVPETVGTAGVLREGGDRTEQILLPQTFEVNEAYLDLSFESSLAATTLDGLDYLENFPYQCVEQTVSKFLPNIMTYRALTAFDLDDPILEQQLGMNVNFALQRLFAWQKVNGGWGWFVNDESNPLVTAYALIGLVEARDQGFSVDDGVIDRARSYLRSTFVTPGLNVPTWQLNRQAFVLYALARAGDPDVARTTTLYESRDRLSYYAKSFLALTLNLIDPDDTSRTDVLMSDLINGAVLSATGAHWQEAERDVVNWNTDTRTTAIALDALIKLRPDSDLLPNVVRYLVTQRTADAWETTQETAWAVMALTDWMVISGELTPDYGYSVTLNDQQIIDPFEVSNPRFENDRMLSIEELLIDEANNLVINRTDGNGALYYTAFLRAYLPVPEVEPLDRGIIVQRRYTMPDDESGESVTSARVGDTIQVRLTVIAPNDLHYVVIEDPIPAGTDAVNPDLATSQQVGTQPLLNPQDPLSEGWGWWYFSNIEFRDEKVVLYSTYLPAGTYEYVYTIRAGLPGVYNVIPAQGYEFYFPDVYGRSAGSTFTIEP